MQCLHFLGRICGHKALLPRSLEVSLCYNISEDPVSCGGLADVWKGQYNGMDVAVQVIEILPQDDARQVRRVSCLSSYMGS